MARKHRFKTTIALDPVIREFLEGQFQRDFFESAVAVQPDNLECLVQLGDIYTRQGHYEKGLQVDNKLVEMCPDEPTFRYNQACSYSLLNCCAQSVDALRQALRLGYADLEHLEGDEFLDNVRKSPLFRGLLEEFFSV